jgi:hypothetical protein
VSRVLALGRAVRRHRLADDLYGFCGVGKADVGRGTFDRTSGAPSHRPEAPIDSADRIRDHPGNPSISPRGIVMAKEIDIAKLRSLVDTILSKIETARKTSTISFDRDFYWEYDPNERYDLSTSAKEPIVGSLHADVDFLEAMLDDPDAGFPLMLIHIAPILHYLGVASGFDGRDAEI